MQSAQKKILFFTILLSMASFAHAMNNNTSLGKRKRENSEDTTRILPRFFDAVGAGNLAKVTRLIRENPNLANRTNQEGKTGLLIAAERNNNSMMRYFIETCEVNKDQADKDGETALFKAAKQNNLDGVKYLVEKDANVNHQANLRENENSDDHDPNTALSIAAERGHFNVVKYLCEVAKAEVNHGSNEDSPAFMNAAKSGHVAIMKYLYNEQGAEQCPFDVLAIAHDDAVPFLNEINKEVYCLSDSEDEDNDSENEYSDSQEGEINSQ